MKYQVYLNKETSEYINRIAEMNGLKPNSQIKQLIEVLIKESIESARRMEREFEKRSNSQ